jgi:hypothetical protein
MEQAQYAEQVDRTRQESSSDATDAKAALPGEDGRPPRRLIQEDGLAPHVSRDLSNEQGIVCMIVATFLARVIGADDRSARHPDQLAACATRVRGSCVLCKSRAKPAKRRRRAGRATPGPTPRLRAARVAPISTRSVEGDPSHSLASLRLGSPSLLRLVSSWASSARSLRLWREPGRFECPSRSAIRRAHCNPLVHHQKVDTR